MASIADWPDAPPLETERLTLEPLRVEHAEEMWPLLDDKRLYTFTGGDPPTRDELRDAYRRRVSAGIVDGRQRWVNWVVRSRASGSVVGGMQATITFGEDGIVAEVAWILGHAHQGHGYAREAAAAMVAWLLEAGAAELIAIIHPRHEASMALARSLGLSPTDVVVAGEIRWRLGGYGSRVPDAAPVPPRPETTRAPPSARSASRLARRTSSG
jgi:RimJ/RimL family protein N-acetyltransferase